MQNQENILIELVYCIGSSPIPEHAQDYIKDLQYIGIKHLALRAESLEDALSYLIINGLTRYSDNANQIIIKTGKMGRKYFSIRDPDGVILEFMEEKLN